MTEFNKDIYYKAIALIHAITAYVDCEELTVNQLINALEDGGFLAEIGTDDEEAVNELYNWLEGSQYRNSGSEDGQRALDEIEEQMRNIIEPVYVVTVTDRTVKIQKLTKVGFLILRKIPTTFRVWRDRRENGTGGIWTYETEEEMCDLLMHLSKEGIITNSQAVSHCHQIRFRILFKTSTETVIERVSK